MKINYHKRIFEPAEAVDIFDIYTNIADGHYLSETEHIHTHFESYENKDAYQADKRRLLPAVVFSGCYDRHETVENQISVQHSGVMNMDIDMNTKADLEKFNKLVHTGKLIYIEAAALSVSGKFNGSMWINVRIEIPADFAEVTDYIKKKLKLTDINFVSRLHSTFYDWFSAMLLNELNIVTGKTKDLKRLRYLNHDDNIYVNYDAAVLPLKGLEIWLQIQDKEQAKRDFKNIQASELTDPFKIAMSFAERKTGSCAPGNYHNFITMLCSCLNRMGILESDAENFVQNVLKVDIKTNCVNYPYKAYSGDFGTWQDWKVKKSVATEAPSGTDKTPQVRPENSPYFMPFGFNKNDEGVQMFWFYCNMSKSLIRLSAAKMSTPNLLQLAPLEWWETAYPKAKGLGVDLNSAIDFLIRVSNEKGFYSNNKVRGRGAWIDNNRIVIHAGTHLIVDGQRYELGSIKTEFLYELGSALELGSAKPITCDDSARLAETLSKLSWEREIDGILLSGWLAIAPVCGVLSWRPHIWITGGAGSGKSWVNAAMKKFIGNISVSVQGNTSEAGLRELLFSDAINVLFDEAEGENEHAQQRIESVLQLMRSASSSDGGMIVKGSGSGAKTYNIRSCFAFCSIVPQAVHGSDLRRVTNLELKRGVLSDSDFEALNSDFHDFATDQYVLGFQTRIINMIPSLLKTISIFTRAITEKLKSRAMGDQLGAMLGGAWHVVNDECPTGEEAFNFLAEIDFSGEQGLSNQTDESKCLQHILGIQIRVETEIAIHTRTLGELVEASLNGTETVSMTKADDHMKRIGIKVENNMVCISTTSAWVKNNLKGTNWVKNYAQVLSRISGTVRKNMTYFTTTMKGPAICIPIKEIFEK
jgi:putative DNA primase/helicase